MQKFHVINFSGALPSDRSLGWLLLSNLFTIVLAMLQQWDVGMLMWIYWGQSVVIGYFSVHRMLDLKKFSTENFTINNRPVDPTPETQRKTAWFFALHYGAFHFAYLVFLLAEHGLQGAYTLPFVVLGILAFYFNHRFSYHYNRERERDAVPNIGFIMFFPYIRILPMHLMIIIGGTVTKGSGFGLLLFLLLKTAADVAMHVLEHSIASKRVLKVKGRQR